MSDLSQPLSLEEEFLEAESEYGCCARVDTDTESSDIEKMNSLSTHTFSPHAMNSTLVFMMIEKGQLLKVLSANASLEKAPRHAVSQYQLNLL